MTATSPATAAPVHEKGLKPNSLGLLAVVAIGISTIAPAYAMTSSLGPTAMEVGTHVPAVLVLGFVPMFMVALGYRELNDAMPDSGTTFTWASRAFGPYVGWMGGWGFLAANIIVLSNLAGVAVDFFYAFLADVTGRPELADLAADRWLNVLTCVVFMALATWVCWRGVEATASVQYALLALQLVVLGVFAVMAFTGAAAHGLPAGMPDASWFNPFEIGSFGAFATAMSLSIFLFWGWDLCLTLNEETRGGGRTAGWGATITAVSVLVIYLVLTIATIMVAGVGADGLGLGNPDNAENVLAKLAGPVMGPFAVLLSLAVLSSSASSLQATMSGPSRTLFAMSWYRALPSFLTRLNRANGTPSAGIFTAAAASTVFYVLMRLVSENVLSDTITALGMMVCFYYAVTAFACVWYFRRAAHGFGQVLRRLVMPGIGGVALAVVFLQTAIDSADPSFGSGSAIGGVGLVFVIGIGVLLLGVLVMLTLRWRTPGFFTDGLRRSGGDTGSTGSGAGADAGPGADGGSGTLAAGTGGITATVGNAGGSDGDAASASSAGPGGPDAGG